MSKPDPQSAAFHVTGLSNIGVLGLLAQPRHDSGLRKPYEFRLTERSFQTLARRLRKTIPKCKDRDRDELQCDLVECKPLRYGWRLQLFLIGFAPGLCGVPEEGLPRERWEAITTKVRELINTALPGSSVYVEEWKANEKFQCQFEAYIQTRVA